MHYEFQWGQVGGIECWITWMCHKAHGNGCNNYLLLKYMTTRTQSYTLYCTWNSVLMQTIRTVASKMHDMLPDADYIQRLCACRMMFIVSLQKLYLKMPVISRKLYSKMSTVCQHNTRNKTRNKMHAMMQSCSWVIHKQPLSMQMQCVWDVADFDLFPKYS